MSEPRGTESDDPFGPDQDRTGAAGSLAWEQENSPYTVEGEIEGFQRFGTGVRYAGGWRRTAGIAMVAVFLAPIVIGVITQAVLFFTR